MCVCVPECVSVCEEKREREGERMGVISAGP